MKSMFPLIEVFQHTSAHARGAACGRAAARQIQHSVATYAQLFAFCGIDWATARQRAMRYLSVINALNPALVDEMQGLAEGSSQSFDAILALNCRTEILPSSYLNGEPQLAGNALAANRAAGIEDWSECTAMAVTAAASADGSAWRFGIQHPRQDEVIVVVEGEIEQWLGQESRRLKPGDAVVIPADMVHASFNVSPGTARITVILGPCDGPIGYEVVDVFAEQPWASLR